MRKLQLSILLICFVEELVFCQTILDQSYTCTSFGGFGYRKVDEDLSLDLSTLMKCLIHQYDNISTPSDCADMCTPNPDCVGFEYSTKPYCQLLNCSNAAPNDFQDYGSNYIDYFKDDSCIDGRVTIWITKCYPNGTIEVTNINPTLYTHVMAVQYQGSSSAIKCTVVTFGARILITGCSLNAGITLYLSDRINGDDDVFVGQWDHAVELECAEIAQAGVVRSVTNHLGARLEVTTQLPVTPSFSISSAIRVGSPTGVAVFSALVGDELYWTIDIPADYNGRPTCTAFSGTSITGSPFKQLITDGCTDDPLLTGNFDNEVTPFPLEKRLWTRLYAFRFYNSDYIYIQCAVKLCPLSSSQCDISCSKKRRSLSDNTSLHDTNTMLTTSAVLHLSSGAPAHSMATVWWLCLIVATCAQYYQSSMSNYAATV